VSIVVIGVNHRTSTLALRERLVVTDDQMPKLLHGLTSRPNIAEAVVLSTCNRTEVYAVAERFHGAYADIRDFFCELGNLAPEDLHPHIYSQHDGDAVAHLFSVAAGLDSAVLGESEILGQVRDAWRHAQSESASRSTLNLLFRHALETGKRARHETAIGRHTASVSHAAVEMVADRLGPLTDKHVLVIGAGEVGEGIAVALGNAGVATITVANRTVERAERLAGRVAGEVARFRQLPTVLSRADVVLTCTGSGTALLEAEVVAAALAERPERPLLIVDVAVPRDVDAAVAAVNGATLLDLDDLRDWAARGLELRAAEAAAVRQIVDVEVERFGMEMTARQAAPLVAALRQRAESVREAELERFATRLATLDPTQREVVEALTKGIVAKLLHGPSTRLKDDAGSPRGDRNASAVRDLFDLL
jgi:glutamyl-tRNA reductase